MPGIPDIQEVGGDFVSLTWEKPSSDGGGRIMGYIIEKKDANYDSWSRVNQVPSPATIFNVANLIEDREYEFRVIAVNEAGESKAASTVRKVKVKDPKGELCHLSLSVATVAPCKLMGLLLFVLNYCILILYEG